jgi:hypothetical protein
MRGVLMQQGQEDIDVYVVGQHDPPSETHTCPYESGAPFGEAWSEALVDGLAYLWGPEVLAHIHAEDLVPTPYKEPALPMP